MIGFYHQILSSFVLMKKKKRILLVYPGFSTFVRRDYEILSEEYEVEKHEIVFSNLSLKSLLLFLKEIAFYSLKMNSIYAVFIWFGDYHSLLPVFFAKLFRKKSYVVIGGSDVASIPEIKYGSFSNPVRAFFTRWSFNWATLCLPVVEALDEKLKVLVPKARSKVVYTGFKPEVFNRGNVKKEKMVLTISLTKNRNRFVLKGLDRFVELARKTPAYEFVIIGLEKQCFSYIENMPSNLKVLGRLEFDELLTYMRRSQFYAQLSLSEGLPSTICETMLCECVPLGTDVGGIKNAIGKYGFVAPWDLDSFSNYILNVKEKSLLGMKARDYVMYKYNYEKRKDSILNVISTC